MGQVGEGVTDMVGTYVSKAVTRTVAYRRDKDVNRVRRIAASNIALINTDSPPANAENYRSVPYLHISAKIIVCCGG